MCIRYFVMIVHDFYLISYLIIVHILVLQALFDLDNNLTMVSQGQLSLHWVLGPASVRGVEVAKPCGGR